MIRFWGDKWTVIHVTIPREQIREAMGPGYEEVMAAVKAQGVGPAGPLYRSLSD
jgi:hypothetical protein